MKIFISMITLNEKDYIKQAVASCGFADAVYIVDGGSTDRTLQKAAAGAREAGVELIKKTIKWANDFSVQRQKALDIVSDDPGWWLRLDADEQFPPLFQENIRSLLESVPENIVAARIKQMNLLTESVYSANRGGWETWPRVFRNLRNDDKSAWHWVGQVHEYCRLMTKTGLVDPKAININLSVIHYGWLSKERRTEREELYSKMPGSGFKKGSLTERQHVARILPYILLEDNA